jgi:hypothetical protein
MPRELRLLCPLLADVDGLAVDECDQKFDSVKEWGRVLLGLFAVFAAA